MPQVARFSWLTIAEIELSALTRQCLDRRIDNLETLNTELTAWQHATNTDQRQVRWQFTTDAHASNYVTYTPRSSRDNLLATCTIGSWVTLRSTSPDDLRAAHLKRPVCPLRLLNAGNSAPGHRPPESPHASPNPA
ncbi:hypothetical protein AB0M80_43285 [Amycolatopsis sp. NPDC051045]|uniref:hypothetical protein n=1 Tax=Amycolatopsis sp. NPDC051045 TaxID=3156922 RepID=UPI0034223505